MVNEEIVGGLKNALDRGSSLKQAMMSFFNAGYTKKEIEEAAATLLNYSPVEKETVPSVPATKEKKLDENKKKLDKKKLENSPSLPTSKSVQKVSQYGNEKPNQGLNVPVPPEMKNLSQNQPAQNIEKNVQKKEKKQKSSGSKKGIIIALIILLVFLIGILVSIFLFREQLIDILSSFLT